MTALQSETNGVDDAVVELAPPPLVLVGSEVIAGEARLDPGRHEAGDVVLVDADDDLRVPPLLDADLDAVDDPQVGDEFPGTHPQAHTLGAEEDPTNRLDDEAEVGTVARDRLEHGDDVGVDVVGDPDDERCCAVVGLREHRRVATADSPENTGVTLAVRPSLDDLEVGDAPDRPAAVAAPIDVGAVARSGCTAPVPGTLPVADQSDLVRADGTSRILLCHVTILCLSVVLAEAQ